MADNAPNFDAMTPEEIMAWMESLAKRQGADSSGFTTDANVDIPEVDPDSVVIDEPGYIPSEGKDRGKKISFGVPIAKPAAAAAPPPAAKPATPPPASAPAVKPPVPAPAAKAPEPPPTSIPKPVVPAPVAKTPPPEPIAPPAAAQLPIFDAPDEGIPAPDWLANLGIGNELPPEPVEAEPEPTSPSLSWLESLAVDSSSALPEFDLSSLGKELTPAITETPSMDTNPVNWLESLSQNQVDVAPAAPAASNPVNWLESLAQEQGVQDTPAPVAASAAEDPVNWLESLAKRQGARDEELTTEADLNLPPMVTPAAPPAAGYSSYTFDSPVPPPKSEPPKQPSPFAAPAPVDPAAWLDSLASQAFETSKPQAAPPPPAAEVMSDSDIQQALKKGELVPHDQMEAWMQRQLKEGASRPEPEELSGDYDPDAPPVKADLPDWLIEQVGDAIPLDEPAPAAIPVAQTPALIDTILQPPDVTDIPDWLKEDEPDTDDLDSIFATPAPENWSETRGFTEAPPSDAPIYEPQVQASSLIDPNDPWVEALEMEYMQAHRDPKALTEQMPPVPTAPTPIISTTTTLQSASLPPETDVPAGQPAAVPDWLGGVSSEPAPAAFTEPEAEASPAMPDWLTMEITEPQTAGAADVPDWLADVDVEPADIPDWLKQTITSTKDDMVVTPTPAPAPAAITYAPPPSAPAIVPVRHSPAPVPVAAQNIDVAATLQNARTHATSNNLDASLPHYEMLIRANAVLDDVVDDLGKLAEKFKTSPAVHRVLGDTLMRQGKLQAALDTYRKALNQL